MPLAAGFVGILPALGLLEEGKDGSPPIRLSWIAAVGWSCSIAFFGVFLSPPLRKQVVCSSKPYCALDTLPIDHRRTAEIPFGNRNSTIDIRPIPTTPTRHIDTAQAWLQFFRCR